jgi:hypothetical protein
MNHYFEEQNVDGSTEMNRIVKECVEVTHDWTGLTQAKGQ